MSKTPFASAQNKGYREAQRIRQTLRKVSIAMTRTYTLKEVAPFVSTIVEDFSPEEKLGYKAIVFGQFLNNELVGQKLSGIEKEFVEEFEKIPVKKRYKEWRDLIALVYK